MGKWLLKRGDRLGEVSVEYSLFFFFFGGGGGGREIEEMGCSSLKREGVELCRIVYVKQS